MSDTPYPRDMVGYGRNRPHPALAGRRAHRRPVRHQLRGGCGEQRAPRRCGLGDAAHRVRLRRAPHRRARAAGRIDVRVRQPRRLLAPPSPVHRARGARHGLRRRHGAPTQSRRGRSDGGGRLGDRQPRLSLDRLSRRARGRGARPYREGDRDPDRAHGHAPARLLPRPAQPEHSAPRGGGRAASSTARIPTPTSCPTGWRRPAGAC